MDRSVLLEYIERIGSLLRAEQRADAGVFGLQAVHVDALRYLERCNRYSNTPAALAAYLRSTKGTVSQTLKLLERAGYLNKTGDPSDGRVVHLLLTAKGRKILKKLAVPARWSHSLERVEEGRYEEAARTLNSLLQHAQLSNGYRTFGACHSCRHLIGTKGGGYRCGLTGEALSPADTARICYEHEPAPHGLTPAEG
ncbi:MAG: MarR family winged helix-turn-helix transcriptional regulator [Gammaproteobacteria bacterium]